MHADSINRIMFKHTLSGSDFKTKRGHWSLKLLTTLTFIALIFALTVN
ncbi:Uncharacterised protein [Plesiomonas shigelloides]|nr:hypothetical protein [Vibrio cholerae]SUB64022.1 Uncharacterised protein [Plesiomonas shigelloides]